MNPWHDKLGCEVNVCQAKQCSEEFMKVCALRKAYQQRIAHLTVKLGELGNSRHARGIKKQLARLRNYD